jgi:hypothetical protein
MYGKTRPDAEAPKTHTALLGRLFAFIIGDHHRKERSHQGYVGWHNNNLALSKVCSVQ